MERRFLPAEPALGSNIRHHSHGLSKMSPMDKPPSSLNPSMLDFLWAFSPTDLGFHSDIPSLMNLPKSVNHAYW
jgi:hypothetical protein